MPETLGEQHLRLWTDRLDDPQFVYVIQGGSRSPIKVGRAKNPLRRLAGLQTGNPEYLHLLYVLPGGAALERRLHERLQRADGGAGEWFYYGPSVKQFLLLVDAVARNLVETYDGSGAIPLCPAFDQWGQDIEADRVPLVASKAAVRETSHKLGHRWRTSREPAPVKISFVEPNPVMPPDQAQRARYKLSGKPHPTSN